MTAPRIEHNDMEWRNRPVPNLEKRLLEEFLEKTKCESLENINFAVSSDKKWLLYNDPRRRDGKQNDGIAGGAEQNIDGIIPAADQNRGVMIKHNSADQQNSGVARGGDQENDGPDVGGKNAGGREKDHYGRQLLRTNGQNRMQYTGPRETYGRNLKKRKRERARERNEDKMEKRSGTIVDTGQRVGVEFDSDCSVKCYLMRNEEWWRSVSRLSAFQHLPEELSRIFLFPEQRNWLAVPPGYELTNDVDDR